MGREIIALHIILDQGQCQDLAFDSCCRYANALFVFLPLPFYEYYMFLCHIRTQGDAALQVSLALSHSPFMKLRTRGTISSM